MAGIPISKSSYDSYVWVTGFNAQQEFLRLSCSVRIKKTDTGWSVRITGQGNEKYQKTVPVSLYSLDHSTERKGKERN